MGDSFFHPEAIKTLRGRFEGHMNKMVGGLYVIKFSNHSVGRIAQRFGYINNQIARAIIRAIKDIKGAPIGYKGVNNTFSAKVVVVKEEDNQYKVITVLFTDDSKYKEMKAI